MLDSEIKLKGFRTALKMMANTLERLETQPNDDWKVGCKFSDNEKKELVIAILRASFHSAGVSVELVYPEELAVEVRPVEKKVLVNESLSIGVSYKKELHSPISQESDDSDSSSSSAFAPEIKPISENAYWERRKMSLA